MLIPLHMNLQMLGYIGSGGSNKKYESVTKGQKAASEVIKSIKTSIPVKKELKKNKEKELFEASTYTIELIREEVKQLSEYSRNLRVLSKLSEARKIEEKITILNAQIEEIDITFMIFILAAHLD